MRLLGTLRTTRPRGASKTPLVILVLVFLPAVAFAQTVDTKMWGVDGNVNAIIRVGDTVYIGGTFGQIGPCTGSGVPVSALSGKPSEPFAKVAGEVKAVVADGQGGWYIGGAFAGVGGLPRANLAHILADGSVAQWAPNPDGEVRTLSLGAGNLYAGGSFTQVGGRPRLSAAAFSTRNGAVTSWNPIVSGPGTIEATVNVLVAAGGVVYLGGYFTSSEGQSPLGVLAVDVRRGARIRLSLEVDLPVLCLALQRETLYVGGYFSSAGSLPRTRLAAIDLRSGAITTWAPEVAGTGYFYSAPTSVRAIVVGESSVYVAGHFVVASGMPRGGVAELDPILGAATAWNPNPVDSQDLLGPTVNTLIVNGRTVYLGGEFSALGGETRPNLAAVDARSAELTAWNPRAAGRVWCLAQGKGRIYAGGNFFSIWGWQSRNRLAALDATTGAVLPWDARLEGFVVWALAADDGVLYVGGAFWAVAGQDRIGIAALSMENGAPTAWNPRSDGWVNAIALHDSTVFAGGQFDNIGGQPRRDLAALRMTTGSATSWNPQCDDIVNTLAVSGSTLYAGGWFSRVGGQPRNSVAALDMESGTATAWDPDAGPLVEAVTLVDTTVYVAGAFSSAGGQQRQNIAALSATSGRATGWSPDANGTVFRLAAGGGAIYAGGLFGSTSGQARQGFAALDASTALPLTSWPEPDGTTWALTVSGSTLYLGGGFRSFGLVPRGSLVAIALPDRQTQPNVEGGPQVLAPLLEAISPNPIHSLATVRFTLVSAMHVSLSIYDVMGRRVTTLLNREQFSPGEHVIAVSADGLANGLYYCRMVANGVAMTRRMIVTK